MCIIDSNTLRNWRFKKSPPLLFPLSIQKSTCKVLEIAFKKVQVERQDKVSRRVGVQCFRKRECMFVCISDILQPYADNI